LVPATGELRVCPKCGKPMVVRTAARGPQVGQQFWGCSGFPECRHTEPITSMPSKTT
jgi:ssDNA-binding Zn-finger/Zn-ribbon topoisomerase 1